MNYVRILIDGYSLLHAWPELCGSNPPHSEAARDALLKMMRLYHDVAGIPVTIFYDGAGAFPETAPDSTAEVEIIYSSACQTADQLIERTALRLTKFGEVAVVTDDEVESSLVRGFGCYTFSCAMFIEQVLTAVGQMRDRINQMRSTQKEQFGQKLLPNE